MVGQFAHKPVHVTISGTMFAGNEEWQTGFYVGNASADAPVPTQAYADAVRDAWITFWRDTASFFSTEYRFTQVKAARLATDGKYDNSDVQVSYPATTQTGNAFNPPMPPQCALVATLIAGSGKGLAGKGRMYLPGICAPVDSTGHISVGSCQGIATKLAAFFDTINSSVDSPGHTVNASKGSKALLYVNGVTIPTNGVRVGNVYDTQRRRRDSLAEVYSAAVVAD